MPLEKEEILAKIKQWQAELKQMIQTLNGEGKTGPIYEILVNRMDDIKALVEAIQDKSLIPTGETPFSPDPVVEEIDEKVKKVKEGVRKIKRLSKEKKKIIE